MPVITKLVAGKRDPSRVNLFLDGKFGFSLSADKVITLHLKINQQLTVAELQELQLISKEERLFAKILNYLSYRPHSRREIELRLKWYLVDHDSPRLIIDSLLLRLENLGYLNDRAFAEWFVRSRMSHRPRSARHLLSELLTKGLDRELAREVVTKLSDDETTLKTLIAKHHFQDSVKLTAYLSRLGFSYDLIRQKIDEASVKK